MRTRHIVALIAGCTLYAATAFGETPQTVLGGYSAQAGASFTPSPDRGRSLFAATHSASADFPSCTKCHGSDPGASGKHAITGKTIAPMSVRANPDRFTDAAKTEKWFRRNCREVIGRECSAGEKADVLAYLIKGS